MERIKYVCKACSYQFSRKAGIRFNKCPYCGKENTVEEQTHNYASKILDEVSVDE